MSTKQNPRKHNFNEDDDVLDNIEFIETNEEYNQEPVAATKDFFKKQNDEDVNKNKQKKFENRDTVQIPTVQHQDEHKYDYSQTAKEISDKTKEMKETLQEVDNPKQNIQKVDNYYNKLFDDDTNNTTNKIVNINNDNITIDDPVLTEEPTLYNSMNKHNYAPKAPVVDIEENFDMIKESSVSNLTENFNKNMMQEFTDVAEKAFDNLDVNVLDLDEVDYSRIFEEKETDSAIKKYNIVSGVHPMYDEEGYELCLGDVMCVNNHRDKIGIIVGLGDDVFFTESITINPETGYGSLERWDLKYKGNRYFHYRKDTLDAIIGDITDEMLGLKNLQKGSVIWLKLFVKETTLTVLEVMILLVNNDILKLNF